MPAALRREDKNVIQRLLDEPYRFEFSQAVSILLRWFSAHGVPRDKALKQHLKFDNSLSLSFPASEIERLQAVGDGVVETEMGLAEALVNQLGLQIHITPAFMGLLGAKGTLPFHYTERILDHQLTRKDEAPRAFLDIFANRVLALFYEAWRKYRFEYAISDGDDVFLPLLMALTGARSDDEGSGLNADRDQLIGYYAGVLQQRPLSATVLGRVLSCYFGVPFDVEECVGHWSVKAVHEQTSVGAFNTSLGANAMLGATTWRPDLYARLTVGPLSKSEYAGFLPSEKCAQALKRMLGLLGDQTVTYEVVPILRARYVQPVQLCSDPATGARAGFDCFLVSCPSDIDRADMHYQILPMVPLPPLPPRRSSSDHRSGEITGTSRSLG